MNERRHGLTRRRALAAGGGAALAAGGAMAVPRGWADAAGTDGVRVRWLGTNAWEVTGGGATVLIDPWVTRFATGAPKGSEWNMDAPLVIDEAAVDEHIDRADCILVTHGHWDHIADVPYVAAKTGATVLGTETHLNLLRAMDTPEEQLAQVGGGEYYGFEDFTVEVFRTSHNVGGRHKSVLFAGTLPGAVPPRPQVVRDLVEGGSLVYLVTFGTISLLFGATANFHRRELEGLRPTVLFLQTPNPNNPDYPQRLLEALGHPPYLVPTHWDDYEEPLKEPAVDWLGAADLGERLKELSPDAEYLLLDHLESHTFTA